uniref:Putative secreted protein n=1 Tax=Anopheles marajoara TaxID=58244 RepID=A0A2M4C5S7_9DIPT
MLASVWNARPRGFFACLQILSSVSSVSACTNSTAGNIFETDQSSVSVGCIGNCSNVFAVAMSCSILNISFSSKQSASLAVVALREDGFVRPHSSSGSSALSRSSAVSSHLAFELSSIRYAMISKSFVSSPASSDLSSSAVGSSCAPPSPALSSFATSLASRDDDEAAPSVGSTRSSESSCS